MPVVSPTPGAPGSAPAPLFPRLASLVYELLLVTAVILSAGVAFYGAEQVLGASHVRAVFQAYLLGVTGAYFVWQWTRGGQTLPMKTWRLRIVTRAGAPITVVQATTRFAFALAGTVLMGAGFLWALVDSEGQFLHDRLAGTRIVRTS